jgi:hypothetical protein
MNRVNPRIIAPGVLAAALVFASCSERSAGELVGEADLAFCRGYKIVNVVIEPATYHTSDPHQLLASAEGCGPRSLDVSVSTTVSVDVSYTGTYTPTNADLSHALGYDVGSQFSVSADSTVLVPLYSYARVDAFPTFQRTRYQVVGFGCPAEVVVGTGVAMKPVGVYFETCGVIGTDPCGVGCVDGRPSGPSTPGFDGDAGAGGAPAAGTGTSAAMTDGGAGDGG